MKTIDADKLWKVCGELRNAAKHELRLHSNFFAYDRALHDIQEAAAKGHLDSDLSMPHPGEVVDSIATSDTTPLMCLHDFGPGSADNNCRICGIEKATPAVGGLLNPIHRPMGNSHHTDAPFTEDDKATGHELAYSLGTLFADVQCQGDGKGGVVHSRYWYYERTSVDEWSRVVRALRIHGLKIVNTRTGGAGWEQQAYAKLGAVRDYMRPGDVELIQEFLGHTVDELKTVPPQSGGE